MATTYTPFIISIVCANLSDGEWVKVTNFTNGGTLRGRVKSGECILNPANEKFSWANGDIIQVETQGRISDSTTTTLSKGGAKVELEESLDDTDSFPAISL